MSLSKNDCHVPIVTTRVPWKRGWSKFLAFVQERLLLSSCYGPCALEMGLEQVPRFCSRMIVTFQLLWPVCLGNGVSLSKNSLIVQMRETIHVFQHKIAIYCNLFPTQRAQSTDIAPSPFTVMCFQHKEPGRPISRHHHLL